MGFLHSLLLKTNSVLSQFDLSLQKGIPDLSMDAAIARLLKRGTKISTCIDIGASDGRWSENLSKIKPNLNYLLIEANHIHEPMLQKFTRKFVNSQYVIAAASDSVGEVFFDDKDAFGGIASHNHSNNSKVAGTTVDFEVSSRKELTPPFLLKLDTHGFEEQILKGAVATLELTSVLILETYVFHFSENNKLFYEICQLVDTLGFYPIDLSAPLYRKSDSSLWQFDIVFVQKTAPEFQKVTFSN